MRLAASSPIDPRPEAAAPPIAATSTPRSGAAPAARAVLAAALLAASLVAVPQAASAAPGNDLGALNVDCDGSGDFLDEQAVVYLTLGDSFVIANDIYDPCIIADPNGILTGEDADHSALGPGVLDAGATTAAITIDAPGTFTIEDAAGVVKTFTVVQGISFRNSIDIGEGAAVGDSFLFEDVYYTGSQYLDATVTVTAVSGLESDGTPDLLDYVDEEGDNFPLSPQVDVDSDIDSGYATLSIVFHESGNPAAPVAVSDLLMTVKDIDSEQYIAAPGVTSYSLSSSPATALTASTTGGILRVAELNDAESSGEDQDHWAVLRFGTVSSVSITVGAEQSGSASFDILFTEPAWAETPTTETPSEAAPQPELAATGANSALIAPATALLVALLLAGGLALSLTRRRLAENAGSRA